MAHAIVTDRYTRSDELHPRCPLSLQVLRHGSKTSTFHYCHIVPKCLEETLRVRLSNNANNIFPSTELIHKNMELYQQVPSLTVKFERQFNDQFDQYTLVFSRELPFFNELRVFIGATDAQPRRVLLATGSRPFFDLHYRAYQEHHQPVVPTISRFDELVSQQLYSQIMLHSPTMKENHKLLKLKKQTSSCFQIAVREDNCNNFPQMGVSRGDAMRLVDTIFQMSSTFFENWQVAERMMPAWIIQHHSRSRTFEIGFRPECDLVVDAEEFKRGFSDDPAHEIWLVSEASLLEYGMPGQVKQIIKMPIMGDLPTAKPISRWHKYRSGKANKPPCRTVSQTTITHHRDEEEITREANSTIECVGATIVVYFSMPTGGKGRWQEGVIITREGDEVRVRYSDGTELRHTLAKIKYKICHPQSHAIQCIRWECTGCGCDNKTDSIPTARSACTECKRDYGLFGVLCDGKRRSTEITSAEREMESKLRRQERPADDVRSPSMQTHVIPDQRGEALVDTASMPVVSYSSIWTCTSLSDASDDASRGAGSPSSGQHTTFVVPVETSGGANNSSQSLQEDPCDTDVIDAEDFEESI